MQLNAILPELSKLYGQKDAKKIAHRLIRLTQKSKAKLKVNTQPKWDATDIALITYADAFQEKSYPTLKTLKKFLTQHIKNSFRIIHILPFASFSSDRGFSVIDYYKVMKEFGSWGDIKAIAKRYRFMADLVANHVSAKSRWFRSFLEGKSKYRDYFIWFTRENYPREEDIQKVRRGRATPLLTPFLTKNGERFLWTTYSVGSTSDQIDLNYRNPEVFLEAVKVFLFYLMQGVRIFRFDGAGSLWKELGTVCKHLPNTHRIIALWRMILKETCPSALVITETTTASVVENRSYLNSKEAHAVYNFALAPLVLYAYYVQSTAHLTRFVQSMHPPSAQNTFFNVLDVHDGINVYAASNLLKSSELQIIYNEVARRGGTFSYRSLPNGEQAVKEMHITWWSALNVDEEDPFELQLQKFVTSRAIAMSIAGIPAVYYLSLFGAKNDVQAFEATHHGRDMNRTNFSYALLASKLTNQQSREYKIFHTLMDLIEQRKQCSAFHPNAKQTALTLDDHVFTVLRERGKVRVLALHNVSPKSVTVTYEDKKYTIAPYGYKWARLS